MGHKEFTKEEIQIVNLLRCYCHQRKLKGETIKNMKTV